jgi:hypothetical protein
LKVRGGEKREPAETRIGLGQILFASLRFGAFLSAGFSAAALAKAEALPAADALKSSGMILGRQSGRFTLIK